MKAFTPVLLVLTFLLSCNPSNQDIPGAIAVARKAMQLSAKGEYAGLKEFYSTEFAESESEEVRVLKFTQLFAATGPVKSASLLDSASVHADEDGLVTVQFLLTTARTKVKQTIVLDSGSGTYKICRMDISQTK